MGDAGLDELPRLHVWELPPPGQGIAALQLLNMLENFDLKSMGRGSADFWHVMTEAKKLVYADRARYYADPDFAKVPRRASCSPRRTRKQRAALIDMQHAAQRDLPGEPAALNRRETTYLCAADENGMMVSLIQSNYTGFGSGYVIPDAGLRAAGSRQPVRPAARAAQLATRRASARSTPSSPRS